MRGEAGEELLEDFVIDEQQRSATASYRRFVQREIELAEGCETGEEWQKKRPSKRQAIVHCHLESKIMTPL